MTGSDTGRSAQSRPYRVPLGFPGGMSDHFSDQPHGHQLDTQKHQQHAEQQQGTGTDANTLLPQPSQIHRKTKTDPERKQSQGTEPVQGATGVFGNEIYR